MTPCQSTGCVRAEDWVVCVKLYIWCFYFLGYCVILRNFIQMFSIFLSACFMICKNKNVGEVCQEFILHCIRLQFLFDKLFCPKQI